MFFRGRINWLIIAICSLKAILIGAKELKEDEDEESPVEGSVF